MSNYINNMNNKNETINNNNRYIIVNNFITLMNNRIERNKMRDYILEEIDNIVLLNYPTNNNSHRNTIFCNDDITLMNTFLNSIHAFNNDELKEIYNQISCLYRVPSSA